MRHAQLLLACSLACGAAPAPLPPLDGLITFSNPRLCEPGDALRALIKGVSRSEEVGDSYRIVLDTPPVPPAFRAQVGKPGLETRTTGEVTETVVSLPLRGTWRGLKLRSLRVIDYVESEGGFSFVFDATREQLRAAANMAGFEIPPSGEFHHEDDEDGVLDVYVTVEKQKGGAALSCFLG